MLTHLLLLNSLLPAPPVGVEPEELLLALLVAHHLLRPGGGAAHQARHRARRSRGEGGQGVTSFLFIYL